MKFVQEIFFNSKVSQSQKLYLDDELKLKAKVLTLVVCLNYQAHQHVAHQQVNQDDAC